jgi:hypothetical protein
VCVHAWVCAGDMRAFVRTHMRTYVRARVMHVSVRTCVRACVHACVRACVYTRDGKGGVGSSIAVGLVTHLSVFGGRRLDDTDVTSYSAAAEDEAAMAGVLCHFLARWSDLQQRVRESKLNGNYNREV